MIRVLALLVALFGSTLAEAADRYWVGGGSSTNWSATGNTNWSASSGGANNASVPATGDNVFFDANSGSGNSVISASQSIGTLDCTGFTGTVTLASNQTLTVDGAGGVFKLVPGMTLTLGNANTIINFTGSSGTILLTSAGKTLPNVTINNAGLTVQLQDNTKFGDGTAAATQVFTLTTGTFDANDFDVTAGNFSSPSSGTRVLSMGNGTWTMTRAAASNIISWSIGTTNLTFNKESAEIVIPGATSGPSVISFSGGGLTYNGVTFNAPTAGVKQYTAISGANTFSSLSLGAGVQYALGADQTVTSAPSIVGTSSAPILLTADAGTTARTLSVATGTVTCTWCVLSGVGGSGGATFTATSSFNLGNASGWAISNPSTGGAHVVGG